MERAAHRNQRDPAIALEGLTNHEICQREGLKRDACSITSSKSNRKHGVKKGEARPALAKSSASNHRSGRKQTTNDQIQSP